MNLSQASPFCKDYHYTTVYTLIPENCTSPSTSTTTGTGTGSSSSSSSSSSSTTSGSSSAGTSGDSNVTSISTPCTRVVVSLQCHQGTPSLYQSFILSGIKTGDKKDLIFLLITQSHSSLLAVVCLIKQCST